MAHPKRKQSHSRTRLRRTHHEVAVPTLNKCPQCAATKLTHSVCPECGTYKGRQVLAVKGALSND